MLCNLVFPKPAAAAALGRPFINSNKNVLLKTCCVLSTDELMSGLAYMSQAQSNCYVKFLDTCEVNAISHM